MARSESLISLLITKYNLRISPQALSLRVCFDLLVCVNLFSFFLRSFLKTGFIRLVVNERVNHDLLLLASVIISQMSS